LNVLIIEDLIRRILVVAIHVIEAQENKDVKLVVTTNGTTEEDSKIMC
jgi:hypothetical protein